MPDFHHSEVVTHLLQQRGSHIQWKHLHTYTQPYSGQHRQSFIPILSVIERNCFGTCVWTSHLFEVEVWAT